MLAAQLEIFFWLKMGGIFLVAFFLSPTPDQEEINGIPSYSLSKNWPSRTAIFSENDNFAMWLDPTFNLHYRRFRPTLS
ncbi:MAG: hypothetical protein ACI808_001800 [Paraglaciecola sp.]